MHDKNLNDVAAIGAIGLPCNLEMKNHRKEIDVVGAIMLYSLLKRADIR